MEKLKEGIISLASMLNKNGKGTLYFGVKNDGEILGQQIGDSTLREISRGIANAIKPQVIPTIINSYSIKVAVFRGTDIMESNYAVFGRTFR